MPQGDVQALDSYLEAASAGSASAMSNIGCLYEHGECGVAMDKSEARNWYEKAANLGNTRAKENLELLQQSNDEYKIRTDLPLAWRRSSYAFLPVSH